MPKINKNMYYCNVCKKYLLKRYSKNHENTKSHLRKKPVKIMWGSIIVTFK